MNILSGLDSLQNIHPLFVHFPVALILVTLMFEALWWMTKKNQFRDFAVYLLILSAVSAVATVITGYIASGSLGHDAPGHEFVHAHRNVMLWMSGFLLFTFLLVVIVPSFREGKLRRFLIVPLFIISGLLVYGADKGGRLVFEYGIGVKAVSERPVQKSEGHEHENEGDKMVIPDSSRTSDRHSDDGHTH